MKYMVNVKPFPRSQNPLRERSYKHQFVEQAKKYLENRYKVYMSTVIADHLRDAQRGGIPSTLNLVSSFVGLKFNNPNATIGLQDTVDGRPLWPLVYFALRCGDIQSALKFMEFASPGHEDFIHVLDDKLKNPDQRIDQRLEMQLKMLYKRQIRNASDPYKRAVYCIIGCCDVHEQHPEVVKTSDDFLWIQLSLIRNSAHANETDSRSSSSTTASSEYLTFAALQSMILEQYGEKHFNATEQPHLYFQVLALTGQFEPAIEFLSRFDRYRTHAVHIALALNEMNMLGLPDDVQQPLRKLYPITIHLDCCRDVVCLILIVFFL